MHQTCSLTSSDSSALRIPCQQQGWEHWFLFHNIRIYWITVDSQEIWQIFIYLGILAQVNAGSCIPIFIIDINFHITCHIVNIWLCPCVVYIIIQVKEAATGSRDLASGLRVCVDDKSGHAERELLVWELSSRCQVKIIKLGSENRKWWSGLDGWMGGWTGSE